jgi:hypothetical protein
MAEVCALPARSQSKIFDEAKRKQREGLLRLQLQMIAFAAKELEDKKK